MGGGPHPRRDLHGPRAARAADRGPRPRQDPRARRLLLRRQPLRVRREGARGDGLRERRQPRERLQRLEAERLRDHDPARPLRRPALALQPPPPHPGGRRGRPAADPRRARAARRRGRARLPRLALPRRRGRRHARDRRRGRRRRVEPPAPGRALDRPPRRAQGALREADARGAQSGRERRPVPGAADLGQRRADPRRRLGRDRGRRRQLPDALPRERRLRLARDPRRARLDLPLRGPDDRVRARPTARATAASSRSRRRRSSPPAAPKEAFSASSPGSSARSRRTRR